MLLVGMNSCELCGGAAGAEEVACCDGSSFAVIGVMDLCPLLYGTSQSSQYDPVCHRARDDGSELHTLLLHFRQ